MEREQRVVGREREPRTETGTTGSPEPSYHHGVRDVWRAGDPPTAVFGLGATRRSMVRVRDLSPDDAPELTDLHGEYGWWADRDVGTVRRALADTEVAVGVEDGDRLVASARVLTDFAYYANVFDVVVAADRRGEGVGERLIRSCVTMYRRSTRTGSAIIGKRLRTTV
jgi:GNAT superfamily N-acetyltransferase